MRNVSLSSLQAAFSENSNTVFLMLLEIEHEELEETLRFVNNNENIIHQGNEYQWFPFEIALPPDSEEQVEVQIKIDDIEQKVIKLLRTITTKPVITLKVVALDMDEQEFGTDDPPETDVVEVGPVQLKLQQYDINAPTIVGTISYEEDFLNQPFPAQKFTPQTAPGMFK